MNASCLRAFQPRGTIIFIVKLDERCDDDAMIDDESVTLFSHTSSPHLKEGFQLAQLATGLTTKRSPERYSALQRPLKLQRKQQNLPAKGWFAKVCFFPFFPFLAHLARSQNQSMYRTQ
eukprot:scaffold15489_cov76-Skeletonema_dohrnii-CCMP3373.AAC.1